jgi:hypothetical protein
MCTEPCALTKKGLNEPKAPVTDTTLSSYRCALVLYTSGVIAVVLAMLLPGKEAAQLCRRKRFFMAEKVPLACRAEDIPFFSSIPKLRTVSGLTSEPMRSSDAGCVRMRRSGGMLGKRLWGVLTTGVIIERAWGAAKRGQDGTTVEQSLPVA